jgi:hypothetical protein
VRARVAHQRATKADMAAKCRVTSRAAANQEVSR